MVASLPHPKQRQQRPVVRFALFLVFTSCTLFLPAGTLLWPAGWLFMAVMASAVASVIFGVFRGSPDLELERRTAARNAKAWDKGLAPIMSGLTVVGVVVAGLGRRFSWPTPFPPWSAWLAVAVMGLGSALAYWAMSCNRFFSSHVRIQVDRGQQVVHDGPYAYIRHPGYLGAMLFTLATPVLLNSGPALALALVTGLATVLRTFLEDRTLQRELPGYSDYVQAVRYRLLPLLW